MRHSYSGKKLSRNTNERRGLIRNIIKSMIIHGAVKTSKAKAQAVRPELEKLITKAKKGTDIARRDIYSAVPDSVLGKKLMEMAQTRFAGRGSGYTRIIKIDSKRGDNTQNVLFSFVDEEVVVEEVKKEKSKPTRQTGKPEKETVKPEIKGKKSKKITK